MKNYIASFKKKNVSFNAIDIEQIWMRAKNRKDAERKARELAKTSNMRYLSIYTVKHTTYGI